MGAQLPDRRMLTEQRSLSVALSEDVESAAKLQDSSNSAEKVGRSQISNALCR